MKGEVKLFWRYQKDVPSVDIASREQKLKFVEKLVFWESVITSDGRGKGAIERREIVAV